MSAVPVLIPPDLKPLLRPLSSLSEFPQNPQRHTDKDVEAFCKVLKEFGWTAPLIVWPHGGKVWISAGHLRYRAATALGMTEVPMVERPEWTERQFKAYVVADNAWTKRGEWDLPELKELLVDLDDGEFDLSLTGFERDEVYAMIHGKGLKPDGKDFSDGVETENECPSCGYKW